MAYWLIAWHLDGVGSLATRHVASWPCQSIDDDTKPSFREISYRSAGDWGINYA
jgi:hypothetical protein